MKMFSWKIPTLFVLCFSLSQVAYPAFENTAAADLLFGKEEKPKIIEEPLLWKTKSDLLSSAANGQMTEYLEGDNNEAIRNSLRKILANDYQTPALDPKSNDSDISFCNSTFDQAVLDLLDHITKVSMAKFGDAQLDFPSENANERGRWIVLNLADHCSKKILGRTQPYPFVNSLASLMKEYSETMDIYANKLHQEKIAAYNQSIINDAELKTKKIAAEEKIKQSEQAKTEFEKSEQAKEKECRNSLAFKTYTLSDDIKYNLNAAQSARQDIAKEKEAGKVSGYVNATSLNKLGRLVVFHEDRANSSFVEYRKNGGTATTAKSVETPKNPCQ